MFSILDSPEKVAKASETLMQILAASPSKAAAAQILTDIKTQKQAPRTLFAEQPAPEKNLGKRKIVEVEQEPARPAQKKARVVKKDPQPTKKAIEIEDLVKKTTPYTISDIKKISFLKNSPSRKHIIYIRDLVERIYQQPESVQRINNLICSLFAHQKSTLLGPALEKIYSIVKGRWPSGTKPKANERFTILVPSATERMHKFLRTYEMSHSPNTDYVNVTIEKSL